MEESLTVQCTHALLCFFFFTGKGNLFLKASQVFDEEGYSKELRELNCFFFLSLWKFCFVNKY